MIPDPPRTPSAVRDTLAGLGIHPSRRLGQSFLADPPLAERIVDTLEPLRGRNVIEVGPGFGALTFPMLDREARLIAVEFDRRLADWLTARAADRAARVVAADAVRTDLGALAAAEWGDGAAFRVVSNLPYSISSPVLLALHRWRPRVESATLMLQREFVDRLRADPGSRDYGSITIAVAIDWSVEVVARAAPRCFHPPPAIESQVVRLDPRPVSAPIDASERIVLERLLRAGFGRRRKQMRGALADLGTSADCLAGHLAAIGSRIEDRFETLTPDQAVELARRLAASR